MGRGKSESSDEEGPHDKVALTAVTNYKLLPRQPQETLICLSFEGPLEKTAKRIFLSKIKEDFKNNIENIFSKIPKLTHSSSTSESKINDKSCVFLHHIISSHFILINYRALLNH